MSSLVETINSALAAVGPATETRMRDLLSEFGELNLGDEDRLAALATVIAAAAATHHRRHKAIYLEAVRTWALEIADPERFSSIGQALSYCGLTSAFRSSAGKEQRGPISKQRNAWLQTALVEAAKLAPRWNRQLAAVYERERERGHRNRATLQVARKLLAYLMAVDKSGQPFQMRSAPPPAGVFSTQKERQARAALQPA